MRLSDIKDKIPFKLYESLKKEGIEELRPSQEKAINYGLLERKNLLVCTPTASGKTLVAELAAVKNIIERKGKAVFIVPLKALAGEKSREFQRKYGHILNVGISIGDNVDNNDYSLERSDIILCTSEKLDALMRHRITWLKDIATVIIDEIHYLNDASRGPTIEMVITLLRHLVENVQIIGLSATIGNPEELAEWLQAELVLDDWRPVELKKGIYLSGNLNFQ